jgi:hypothetical protein
MATATFTYPDAVQLRQVEQVLLPQIVEDDPIFDEFPMTDSEYDRLIWEQKDNYQGLQQVRGLEGAPRLVKRPGSKTYDMEPGYYGEFTTLREKELTQRRQLGSFDTPVSIDDLVGDAQTLLLQRRLDRIRQIIWSLLTTGTFAIPNGEGRILHTDIYPLLTMSAAVPWSTSATATPTIDIRAAQLLSLGQSVSFGADSRIWMNRVTANRLLNNTNPADQFGRRINAGNTTNSLADVNANLESNDLPQVMIYDRFYIDDTGTPQRFIPNGVAVLIGKRTNGARLGEYRMTRNANNPRLEPGAYTRVIDRGETSVPRVIEVHDGHNGGPVIFFPGAFVVLTVG